jgi:translation initiation factor IF-2
MVGDDHNEASDSRMIKPRSQPSTPASGRVRQSFPHGRSKSVVVEKVRKRVVVPLGGSHAVGGGGKPVSVAGLSKDEYTRRVKALEDDRAEKTRLQNEEQLGNVDEKIEETRGDVEVQSREECNGVSEKNAGEVDSLDVKTAHSETSSALSDSVKTVEPGKETSALEADETGASGKQKGWDRSSGSADYKGNNEANKVKVHRGVGFARGDEAARKAPSPRSRTEQDRRRSGKLTMAQALAQGDDSAGARHRSLASIRRRQARDRRKADGTQQVHEKFIRDVKIPDAITVQELANRMAEKGSDVIKILMKMGVMATITQSIDGDTAQLIVEEFAHRPVRVSDSDVEEYLKQAFEPSELLPRAPVVTVIGHVDHGKTSLLDSLRDSTVAAREAGGITQHIGAHRVITDCGKFVTFLDTPGHEAFTMMRARGVQVTDVCVLVVAADDGVMPQTVEAINHAKAAGATLLIAINKVDKPGANPQKIREELLQHGIIVEFFGGEILDVEVSAKTSLGVDKLLESILLQAEILDLKACYEGPVQGTVIEAKLDIGQGSVATLLVTSGEIRIGDVFVVGQEWGRVRALIDDCGKRIKKATASMPVEVLGLQGTPQAGDVFQGVESDVKARNISDYRKRKAREKQAIMGARGTVEQLLTQSRAGREMQEFLVIIKADVQGSIGAVVQMLDKICNDEVRVRILHAAVGAITETDIALAEASSALVVGFNVRANTMAREVANQKGVSIRYYSVIYSLADDIRAMTSGLLKPEIKETIIGQAEVLEVFRITKVGNIAGCRLTDGVARRDSMVRLLRDDIVICERKLSALKRFKDDAKEVYMGQEFGVSIEDYQNIKKGDVIEFMEIEEIQRTL